MAALTYGNDVINIADSVDIDELFSQIRQALSGGDNGPWIEFRSPDGVVNSILVSAGIAIRIAEAPKPVGTVRAPS